VNKGWGKVTGKRRGRSGEEEGMAGWRRELEIRRQRKGLKAQRRREKETNVGRRSDREEVEGRGGVERYTRVTVEVRERDGQQGESKRGGRKGEKDRE